MSDDAAAATAARSSGVGNATDPVLQSPLGPAAAAAAVGDAVVAAAVDGPEATPAAQRRRLDRRDRELRPELCALVVAARVLRLSAEARYAAACLLCRYRCLAGAEADGGAEAGAGDRGERKDRDHSPHRNHRRRRQDDRQRRHGSDGETDDAPWVRGACLFLGSKVAEQPRRLRDVVNCVRMVQPVRDPREATEATTTSAPLGEPSRSCSGGDAGRGDNGDSETGGGSDDADTDQPPRQHLVRLAWCPTPPPLDAAYWAAKRRLVAAEQRVLRWLAFDAQVPSPHRAVLLVLERATGATAPPPQQRRALARAAWRRVNDSLFALDCLRRPVLALAGAAVALAGREVGLWGDEAAAADAVDCRALGVSPAQLAATQAALERIRQQLSAGV